MSLAEFHDLQQLLLVLSFVLAVVFGWVTQKSHFCTMGAVSDIVNMGDWTRMRMWALAIAVAMLGFWGLAWSGQIEPADSVYSVHRLLWLSALCGGLLFGFGMVLASGCASKTLLRLGAGSFKALLVFVVMGASAQITSRGFLMDWRNRSVDQVQIADINSLLPSWLAQAVGLDLAKSGMLLSLLIAGALLAWVLRSRSFRQDRASAMGGLGIGLCLVLMWWISGSLGLVQEHPQTLEASYLIGSGQSFEALSFVGPSARTLEALSTESRFGYGTTLVAGVIVGAALQALRSGSFRWEGLHSVRDTGSHVIGAICMGIGGITAGGCTVGQGLSGISTLSVISIIALAGILAGAVLALRLQSWRVMRGANF